MDFGPDSRLNPTCGAPLIFRVAPPPEMQGSRKEPFSILPPGAVLNQSYRVEGFLAVGGMSLVYRAAAPFGPCVLKEVPATSPREVISLNQEKALLDRLQHPQIPKAYGLFEQEGFYYLALQLIEGSNLQQLLPPFPSSYLQEQVVRDWALQLCDVFEYLHSQVPPVIYRDLKPRNILKDRNGKIHLVDFGVARVLKEDKERDTELFGTAMTASPEHYGLGQTDARSDIYTLGATLHYLLTKGQGRREEPFSFSPVRSINPALSQNLEQVLDKATRRQPEQRYQSIAEMRQALLNTRAGSLPVLEPYGQTTGRMPALPPVESPPARGFSPTALAVGAGFLLAGGFLLARLFDPRPPADPPVPAASSPVPVLLSPLSRPRTPAPIPTAAAPSPGLETPPAEVVLLPHPRPQPRPVATPHAPPAPAPIPEPAPAYPVARPRPRPESSATLPPAAAEAPFPFAFPALNAPAHLPQEARVDGGYPVRLNQVSFVLPDGFLELSEPSDQRIYLHSSRTPIVLAALQPPAPGRFGHPEEVSRWLSERLAAAGAQEVRTAPTMVNGKAARRCEFAFSLGGRPMQCRFLTTYPRPGGFTILAAQFPAERAAELTPTLEKFFTSLTVTD